MVKSTSENLASVDDRIGRRTLIRRAAATGAVAWTAPLVVDSLVAPVGAQTSGTTTLFLTGASTANPGSLSTAQGASTATKLIAKDGAAVNAQTDPTKFHTWQYTVPAGGLTIVSAQLFLWTTGSTPHAVTAGLFDCVNCTVTANSNSCTLLDTAASTNGAAGERVINFGPVGATLAAGRCFRLKIVNQDPPSSNDFTARWNGTSAGTSNSRLVLVH
jgi:hypothetical protein